MKVKTAEFVRSAFKAGDFVRDGLPAVAFVGRSNVGKSSLMNRLLGSKKLARTSSTPGRTRSVNYFLVNRNLYFVDLPGYGYAKAGRGERAKWAEVTERFFREAPQGLRVVLLVDLKVGATPLDESACEFLALEGAEVVVVATKMDRIGRSQHARKLREIAATLGLGPEAAPIPVSARTGDGIAALWKEISRE
ncbi:MAG: ribosome biogenesis GTP-binding protein YihA/YsxC [Acidobacteriota bacterium]|nr:ribosome biogenesis GTP-binding protein YihA/YsxC [Acidobacteriota bacterium]